jgi:hypothetical protein
MGWLGVVAREAVVVTALVFGAGVVVGLLLFSPVERRP